MKNKVSVSSGLTRVELLVVLATISVLGFLLIPRKSGAEFRAERINCVANLKQIGVAVLIFGNDHGKEFPWRVPLEKGGSQERVSTGDPTYQFLAMTNALVSPKVLSCVSDRGRKKVADFVALTRNNISYFLCLEADENRTNNLLVGDRNITGGFLTNGVYVLPTTGGKAGWAKDIHGLAGNIGLSDGSVQQVTVGGLNRQLQVMTNETVRLLVP